MYRLHLFTSNNVGEHFQRARPNELVADCERTLARRWAHADGPATSRRQLSQTRPIPFHSRRVQLFIRPIVCPVAADRCKLIEISRRGCDRERRHGKDSRARPRAAPLEQLAATCYRPLFLSLPLGAGLITRNWPLSSSALRLRALARRAINMRESGFTWPQCKHTQTELNTGNSAEQTSSDLQARQCQASVSARGARDLHPQPLTHTLTPSGAMRGKPMRNCGRAPSGPAVLAGGQQPSLCLFSRLGPVARHLIESQ